MERITIKKLIQFFDNQKIIDAILENYYPSSRDWLSDIESSVRDTLEMNRDFDLVDDFTEVIDFLKIIERKW